MFSKIYTFYPKLLFTFLEPMTLHFQLFCILAFMNSIRFVIVVGLAMS